MFRYALALIVIVISSCDSGSDSSLTPSSGHNAFIAIPATSGVQQLQQGTWRAFINIPDAQRLTCDTAIDATTCGLLVDIDAGEASTKVNLAAGEYNPQLIWEYHDATFSNPARNDGFWSIANAKKPLIVEAQNTSLTFSFDDYKPLPDDDDDGMSNLAELEDRTDPSDPNDPPRDSVCPAQMTQYFSLEEDNPPYTDLLRGISANCTRCPTAITGLVGTGQRFDGNNEIDVPDNGQFDWGSDDEFSIEYWMRSASACTGGVNEVIVGRQGANNQKPHLWTGCSHTAEGRAIFVLHDAGGGTGGNSNWPRSTNPITDGQWHHIVAVKTKTQIHLYTDGEKSSAEKIYVAGFDSTTPLNIGYINLGDSNTGSRHFRYEGDLDEVAYYSRALTDEEVSTHFNRGQQMGRGYCERGRR